MSTATFDTAQRETAPPEAHSREAPATLPAAAQLGGEAAELTRVYRARTVEELIPKIQAELGADAIVVRRHKGLTGGIAGFFQRPFVEIEAKAGTPRVDLYDEDGGAPAFPDADPRGQAPAMRPPHVAYASNALTAFATGGERELQPNDALELLAGAGAPAFRELTPSSLIERTGGLNGTPEPARNGDPFAAALAEAEAAVLPAAPTLGEAEAAVLPVTPASAEPHTAVPPAAPQPAEPKAARAPATATLTERPVASSTSSKGAVAAPTRGRARSKIEESLLGYGLGEALVRELIETAAAHVLPLMPARSSLASAVGRTITQRIPTAPPLPVGSTTIALVGPGGSGKTACCAGLLDAYRERSTLPAACASILPGSERGELEALLSPQVLDPTPIATPQVAQALREARENGLLLLDLPTLSPADRNSIRACTELLESQAPDRVIIALPATFGAKPAAQLLEALRPLGASALAITHADETDQLGVAVEAACAFGLAPEYLLDRSSGRGGLIQIDPAYLADRLLG
jgi:flagellar biosynthesis GTPase FlhF